MIIGNRMTNPGELRTRVTLLRRTMTADPGGAQVPGTAVIGQAWVRWENVHGSEVWQAAAVAAEKAATVLLRYQPGLDTTCLVQLGSEIYEVVSVDDIQQRHEYMELKVKRWVEG